MFSDFAIEFIDCIIVIIGDRPTCPYYNFCLSSLWICITVIIGDKPTGLYLAYNYRFDVCSWELRPNEGRELFLCLVDFAGVFEC